MRSALVAGLLLAAASLPAAAVDWYVGVGAAGELDGRAPKLSASDNRAETARLLLGGVEFQNHFGIEAGWVDLGDISATGLADAGYATNGDLWTIAGTWSPDTGKVRPYAKLGWFSRQEDGTAHTIAGDQPISFDDSGLTAEVGGRWHINQRFALRAGYAWYDFDSGSDGSLQAAAEIRF